MPEKTTPITPIRCDNGPGQATFRNGVLEITMPAPPEQVTRGRRLEINQEAKK